MPKSNEETGEYQIKILLENNLGNTKEYELKLEVFPEVISQVNVEKPYLEQIMGKAFNQSAFFETNINLVITELSHDGLLTIKPSLPIMVPKSY